MTDEPTITIGAHAYALTRPTDDRALEAECILVYLLGPAMSSALSGIIETFASQVIAVAGDVVEPDATRETFDLARLLELRSLDSTDPRLRAAWGQLTATLPRILGDTLADAVPQFSDRAVNHERVARLFELLVCGCVFVDVAGETKRIESLRALSQWSQRDPAIKWRLLGAQLGHCYGDALTSWAVRAAASAMDTAKGGESVDDVVTSEA